VTAEIAAKAKVAETARAQAAANAAAYETAMQAGQQALDARNFQAARGEFVAALRLKPELTAALDKIKEIEAREALFKGDTERDAGNVNAATLSYSHAADICPNVVAEANARLPRSRKPSRLHRS